jgi:hypothetical protein
MASARCALAQGLHRVLAHLVERHAQGLQDADRHPLGLTAQAQQKMLGSDVVVAEAPCLVNGQLDHVLG